MIRTRRQALEDLEKKLKSFASKTRLAQKCRAIAIVHSTSVDDTPDYVLYVSRQGNLSLIYQQNRYYHLGGDRVEIRNGIRTVFSAQEKQDARFAGNYRIELVKAAVEKFAPKVQSLYKSTRGRV